MVFGANYTIRSQWPCVSQRRKSKKLLTCYIGLNIDNVVQSVNFSS
jgi:hypothetical protein